MARRRARQKGSRRSVVLLAVAVLAAVLAIPAYAYYSTFVAPLQEQMVRVNDRVFTVGDYVRRLRYLEAENGIYGRKLDYGVDPFQLMDDFRDNELIAAAGPRLGITVTDQEVTRFLQDRLGASPKEGEQVTQEEVDRRFQELYKQRLAQVNLTDPEYRKVMRELILKDKLKEHLSVRVPAVAEQVNVLGMMLQDEQAAADIKKRLEKGEEFRALARDNSIDQETKDNRGEMGWLPKGTMDSAFDEIAFNLPAGQVSEPFWMRRGIWIIRVLEHDQVRKVEGQAREKLKNRVLEEWLEEERKQNNIERYFNSDRYEYVLNRLKQYRRPDQQAQNQPPSPTG